MTTHACRPFARVPIVLAMLLAAASAGLAAQERAAGDRLPRVLVEDATDRPAVELPALPFPVGVRVIAAVDDPALDARLALYAARRTAVWLSVRVPESTDRADAWRVALQQLLARHAGALVALEVRPGDDPKLATFATRLAATEARAVRDTIRIALFGEDAARGEWLTRFFPADLAPYVDLLVVGGDAGHPPTVDNLEKIGADVALVVARGDAGDAPAAATTRVRDGQLETLGTNIVAESWRIGPGAIGALTALGPLSPLMTGDVITIDPQAAGLSLSASGTDVTGTTRHRLLFDNRTFATYLVYWNGRDAPALDVSINLPVEGVPVVYALADGSRADAAGYARTLETGQVRARLSAVAGPVLVDFNAGAEAVFAERSDVAAERRLSVEEVIARHQQQQRAQDALVRNYVASAITQQHFRPSVADPGYDVVTENRYFVAADGIEWEELSFSVNGSKWGADRPPFPLLQPEKVLSLPLQLRFDAAYRYRLTGTERVDGYDCYVVRFEPLRDGASLYRGTIWIDRRTFARIRVQAVQSGLAAPVVSNEEIQSYRPVTTIGNRPVFLFAGLTARQIMMIAGRNILVEKSVTFADFRVNPEDFDGARTEARRGSGVMYRETDRGLRYFVKQGDQRVVSERATQTARAMAMGVTLDPSYAFPLPILGLNYLDFEFGGPDTQLAMLFGGVLAAVNVQRPTLGATPFDASVDMFAIAVPSSDRLYESGGERDGERVLTWPLTTGLNLGWQYTPFQKVTGQYHFRFDGYTRDTTTSEAFRVPASTLTNGLGGAWEYRRAGNSLVVNGTWSRRIGWRDWGLPDDPTTALRSSYLKYGASLSRDFYFNVFHKVHLNASWFGGRDLDRFAKYQFGMFDDTRIHGVPASGARFEELGMLRGSYSFNIFEQYRLDLFLERAWGRDKLIDPAWQPITGLGAAVNLRAKWNTILRIDAGKSFLPDRYQGIGSATLQVLILKPLR